MFEESIDPSETHSVRSEDTEIVPGYCSMEQFTKDGFKVLMDAIRHSNALPTGRNWNFYSTSDSFMKIVNNESSRVLHLMNQIMRGNDIESNIRNRVLDEKTELVVEANDVILERVANNIDEINGVSKSFPDQIVIQTVSAELPVNGSWNRPSAATITVNSTAPQLFERNCIKLITAKNILRPQKFFIDKIDNNSKYPWCPRIIEKPNSLKPLAIFLEEFENGQEFCHPYEFELDRFTPTTEQLLEEVPQFPTNVSETPLVEIDKPEQLDDLVETLRTCKEFAVDLEHHSYRTYMGITCLLQISTEEKDYLIDTLALRDKLYILNEVFTKNNIVKIFHGADKDVEWLQRDLSIYVVNMFDTHQAAKVLEYSALSLAFLMKKFCNFLPKKQFQLADWRIRPLPEEFKMYAREDTHFLIYIYKVLKRELLSKGNKSDYVLRSVIERSTEICKKRYFKPVLNEDSHLNIYRKCKKMFDNRQLYALKEIFAWRDNLAREEDESLGYVLPNHMLLQISETLPREMQGILACCNPIPPLVRSHLLELHKIILKAREQPLEKAILKEDTTGRGVLKKISKVNFDSVLQCPHDLSKTNEFRDDLPTLLNNNGLKFGNINVVDVDLTIEKPASYPLFNNLCSHDDTFNERKIFKTLHGFAYFSPYERYKLVKPLLVEKEKAVQIQKEQVNIKELVKENGSENRTDDERIASIRDHFVQLSKKFNEEMEAKKQKEEKPLIKMGGSKKRKRDFECENGGLLPQAQSSENNMCTPAPNLPYKFNNNTKKRERKRKCNEINSGFDNQNNEEKSTDSCRQVRHFYKKKKRNGQQNQQKNQNQNDNDLKRKVEWNKQAQPKRSSYKYNEKNRNFISYDYASVDFRQFQGGAGSATNNINIKSNFKAKRRRKMEHKGATASTFKSLRKTHGKKKNGNG